MSEGLSLPVAWATGIIPGFGARLRLVINGVLCERVSLDGKWLTIDGHPVYMEI